MPNIAIIQLLMSIFAIYLVSSQIQQNLISFFSGTLRHKKVIVYIVWAIYLPGIIFHEVAHLLAALCLFLKVHSMNLLPVIVDGDEGGHSIKFGSVTYYKADPFRGLLVGIAPLFLGVAILILLFYKIEFPNSNVYHNIFFIYSTFVVSSTMFSSKKDLADLLYVVPVIILVAILLIVLKINPFLYINLSLTLKENGLSLIGRLNQIFLISLIINSCIYAIVKILKR